MQRFFFFSILTILAIAFLGAIYIVFLKSNIKENTTIFIRSNDTFEDVLYQLSPALNNVTTFRWVAAWKGYLDGKIIPGKYVFKKGESNRHIINKLKAGLQDKIILTLAPKDFVEEWIGYIHPKIEADSLEVLTAFQNFARENKLDDLQRIKFYVFAETHFVFWNDKPNKIIDLLYKDYQSFWTKDRIRAARRINLTPEQVMNLAAIVQKESSKVEEFPRIAGLYLNRLQKRMKLQSDPTVMYGKKILQVKKKTIPRLYLKDLLMNSPYNTYRIFGFPPHPICFVTKKAAEAVLHAEKHNFLFMCASVDRPGYHEFAEDYSTHEQFAKKYAQWLDERNIR